MKKILKVFVLVLTLALFSNNVDAKADYVKRDSLGRVTQKIEYHKNGKVKEKEIKTYYKNTDEEVSEKEWKYNYKGKRVYYSLEKYKVYWDSKEQEYDSNTIYKQKIKYTSKGIKKSKSITKYSNKKTTAKTTYSYNRKGKLKSNKYGKAKRVKYYYKNGKWTSKVTAYYNSKGKLKKGKKVVNKSKTLTTSQIKKIALNKTNGGTITKFEVDYENGKKYYEIEIIKGSYEYDLTVSTTGKIVEYDVDYED